MGGRTGSPLLDRLGYRDSMLENQGVKKVSTLETPKSPKSMFTSAGVHVHAKHSNEQPLTSRTCDCRIARTCAD
jgi:hypothetical protein